MLYHVIISENNKLQKLMEERQQLMEEERMTLKEEINQLKKENTLLNLRQRGNRGNAETM